MDYPTKLYPTPPKMEWFCRAPTGLHNLGSAPPPDENGAVESLTTYQKQDFLMYESYLSAHRKWVEELRFLKAEFHDDALRKRYLAELHEQVGHIKSPPYRRDLSALPSRTGQPTLQFAAVLSEKKDHKPTLSTKPHEAEKRDKKKKLRDARAKAQAEALQARIELVAEDTSSTIKEKMKAVKNLKQSAPLHKEELAAAKSAAQRAKQIRVGSSDFTTNILPEEGWKVVTRKKGDYWPQFVRVDTPVDGNHLAIRMDPAVGSIAQVTNACMRRPTQTGSK